MSQGAPWRTTEPWSKEYLEKLKSDVRRISAPAGSGIQHLNILLLGPVGAGKSSFFNTISSTFQDRLSQQAEYGSATSSVTTTFRMYKVRDRDTTLLDFRLCDSQGLEENLDNMDEFKLILEGYLSDGYKHGTISVRRFFLWKWIGYIKDRVLGLFTSPKRHPAHNETPSMSDKMHGVCFVLDSTTVKILEKPFLEKLTSLKKVCSERGIPFMVILTKVDGVCQKVARNISTVFHSQDVKDVVDKAAEIFEVPENNVHPVKNYEKEIDTSVDIGILSLISLKFMLSRAQDSLLNKFDYDHSKETVPGNKPVAINMPPMPS